MVSIGELIAFCYEKSKNIKLKAEPEVFIHLAQLLEELSRRRVEELFRKTDEKAIRDKAIDDFVTEIKAIQDQDEPLYNILWDEIAEQLKAGGSNDD